MKKFLALILVLALCLGLVPLAALAADEPAGDGPAKVITSGLKWWDLTAQGADHFVAAGFAADCAYFLNDAPCDVNDVKTAAAKRGTVVEVYTNADGEISAVKAYEYTAALVEGEVMLVCKLDEGDGTYRYTREKAEKITGKVAVYNVKGTLTINGVSYEASQQKTEEDVSDFRISEELFANWTSRGGTFTDEYNFYLDKNGSIIAITSLNPNRALNRVCMVVDARSSWDGSELTAELLFVDGSTENVTVTKLGDQSVVAQPTQDGDQIAPADARQALGAPKTKFFRYHATDDGYELTELTAAEASGNWEAPVSLGDGSATVATVTKESRFAKAPYSTSDLADWDITADDNTLFIVGRRSGINVVCDVYRNFRNIPEMDVTMMTALCANTSDSLDTVARIVYLERWYEQPWDVDLDPYTAGYIFITDNVWTLDPTLYRDDVCRVKIVDAVGNLATMRVTRALADAIAADSLAITQSRNYAGHFFAVGEISTKGVVSSLTNGATPPAAKAVTLDDVVAMGNGTLTLSGGAYQYDAKTHFVYVDTGWTDGDQIDNKFNELEPNKDNIDFKDAGIFDPEHFFDPKEVGPDQVYTSVKAVVIPSATDKALADLVYVLRTLEIPADALAIPDVTPSPSPEPSASSEPSPSTKPGGGGSLGGGSLGGGSLGGGSLGGGGSTATTPAPSQTPAESPQPTQSQPPVEPSASPATPASQIFQDVAQGAWYEAGVTYVVDKGLFQGVADGVFSPNTDMTRAMLMTVLARLDGQDTNRGETWYDKGMDWAKANAISDGTQPEASVTREQLVTMLYRYAKPAAAADDLASFADGDNVSPWAAEAMAWAVRQGIVTGKDGNRLDPQGTATRAEVATILQRFVALSK